MLPIVAFYDMQENTSVLFYSHPNRRGQFEHQQIRTTSTTLQYPASLALSRFTQLSTPQHLWCFLNKILKYVKNVYYIYVMYNGSMRYVHKIYYLLFLINKIYILHDRLIDIIFRYASSTTRVRDGICLSSYCIRIYSACDDLG